MQNYILNRETQKIELHFEKSEYQALTDAQKQELKSAFLWSNYGKCWVSRAKEPNTWRAERVAEKLGFTGLEKTGERLTYAEQLERQADKAERRADRYEGYAANAEKRAAVLQKPLDNMRGDIAFFTQPIIAGHAGSQAFARQRERMYAKYHKGFEEYKKSEYYQDRASTARATASNDKLTNAVYLDKRIKENNKSIRDLQGYIVKGEEALYKLQQGEELKNYKGEPLTVELLESRIEDLLERYEAAQDKLNFFEDCMEKIGGVQFSQENIKAGYIVEMKRWGKCKVLSAGPVNVTFQIMTGGASGGVLTDPYAAVVKIIAVQEAPKIENPYKADDVLYTAYPASGKVYRAFQVVKATEKSIQIQEITVNNGTPQIGQFKSNSKPERKGVVKSRFSDAVCAYYDDWQLYKYTAQTVEPVALTRPQGQNAGNRVRD